MDMSPLRPQNYLFGCELKADRDYHFKLDNDENEHQLSLRMVSLGAGAKDELHIVEAEAMNYEGSPIKVTLATLKMSVQPTVSLGGFEITYTTCGLMVEVWFRACVYQWTAFSSCGGRCRVRRRGGGGCESPNYT